MHTCHASTPPDRRGWAFIGNGLLGLRVPPGGLGAGRAMLNGFVHRCPRIGMEAAAPLPYPLALTIGLDGVSSKRNPEAVEFVGQDLDLARGEVRSHSRMRGRQATGTIAVVTRCLRHRPGVAMQELRFEVDRACAVALVSEIDLDGMPGSLGERLAPPALADLAVHWQGLGGLSSCGIAVATALDGVEHRRGCNAWGFERETLVCDRSFSAEPGRTYVLRQTVACVPSLLHGEPHWQAIRLLAEAVHAGWERQGAEHERAWAELWRGRPVLAAPAPWQDLADAAFHQLHASAGPCMPLSLAPFGIADPDPYHGHVFWDCETFAFPPLLLTAPAAAREIVAYRAARLDRARALARQLGHDGLCFPWQSCLSGDEVTPLPYRQLQERHISMDVAIAMAQYAETADEADFAREQAWPVLSGVARWIASAAERTARGWEIRGVTGVDESVEDVANDAYTNLTAAWVLRAATALAVRIGAAAPARWTAVAAGLVLNRDASGALLVRDGGAADNSTIAVAFFPQPCAPAAATEQASLRAVLGGAGTWLGQPMVSAPAATWAARLGDRRLCSRCLDRGVRDFARTPFLGFAEVAAGSSGFSGADTTPFMSAAGGWLQTLYLGLPGLQIRAGGPPCWPTYPVVLPESWESITVERLHAQGRNWRLEARHGQPRAELTALT
jgi:hypothetical protein